MGCISIPFQRLPHQPKLFLRFLSDFSSVSQFYPHPPTLEAIQQAAKAVDYPQSRRKEVVTVLRETNAALGGGEAVAKNIDRLANGAVAVLSGQQVGLFGGPAYAFYKALSAIQIAHELTQSGVDAVPIFWMATEDHDHDEVRHVSWFNAGKRTKFDLSAEGAPGRPVGQVKLGPAVEEIVKSAVELLGGTNSPNVAKHLAESYTADESYGSAFGKLFARVFADYGLILVDPLDARLHRIAAPVYRKALSERATINAKLLQRDKDLEGAGFAPQVKVTPETTLLFQIREGVRQPIVYQGEHGGQAGAFKIGDSVARDTESERAAAARRSGLSLSDCCLLRRPCGNFVSGAVRSDLPRYLGAHACLTAARGLHDPRRQGRQAPAKIQVVHRESLERSAAIAEADGVGLAAGPTWRELRQEKSADRQHADRTRSRDSETRRNSRRSRRDHARKNVLPAKQAARKDRPRARRTRRINRRA
jgi:Bacillithiol biosynthesis BshC